MNILKAKLRPDAAPPDHIPAHVAIVMDGNGRWAERRGLPRIAGHRAGAENVRRVVEHAAERGLSCLTLYAFSTENWERPEAEVRGLLAILAEALERETPKFAESGVRVQHMGRLDRLSPALVEAIQQATAQTAHNRRLTLNVCFNYGGRTELIDAVQRIVAVGVPAAQVTEQTFSQYLYSSGTPDPDLVIRTAGEQRLSNFLVWQAAYSEYWFTPCYWPDFDAETFDLALADYAKRVRKFGKTADQVKKDESQR